MTSMLLERRSVDNSRLNRAPQSSYFILSVMDILALENAWRLVGLAVRMKLNTLKEQTWRLLFFSSSANHTRKTSKNVNSETIMQVLIVKTCFKVNVSFTEFLELGEIVVCI